jgi:hypothetical protein
MILTLENRSIRKKNLPQCHFVHHKSYMDSPAIDPRLSSDSTKQIYNLLYYMTKTLMASSEVCNDTVGDSMLRKTWDVQRILVENPLCSRPTGTRSSDDNFRMNLRELDCDIHVEVTGSGRDYGGLQTQVKPPVSVTCKI